MTELTPKEEYLAKVRSNAMLAKPGSYNTLISIAEEYSRARQKFPPMHSPHEGHSIIQEEFEEMWDAIKSNDIEHARKECLQVAAMCLAFLLEVK